MGLPAQERTAGLAQGGAPTPMRYGRPSQKQLDQALKGMGNKAYSPPKPKTTRAPAAQEKPPRDPSGNPYKPGNKTSSGPR